jgi:hypothetical protein
VRAAADAAIAEAAAATALAAPAEAALLATATARLHSTTGVSYFKGCWTATVSLTGNERLAKCFDTCLQAACAADLASLALGKAGYTNLPRSIYTGQQVAAMRALLLFERPGWAAALQRAAEHERDHSMAAPGLTTAQLVALKNAASQAAAAAAATVQVPAELLPTLRPAGQLQQQVQQQHLLHGCRMSGQSWRVDVDLGAARGKYFATFEDGTTAACAADLARLGNAQRWLNFPAHTYSSQQIAAFQALLSARFPGVKLTAAGAALLAASNNHDCDSTSNSSSSSGEGVTMTHQPLQQTTLSGSSQVVAAAAAEVQQPADAVREDGQRQQQQKRQQRHDMGCRQQPAAVAAACGSICIKQLQVSARQQIQRLRQQQERLMQLAAIQPAVTVATRLQQPAAARPLRSAVAPRVLMSATGAAAAGRAGMHGCLRV